MISMQRTVSQSNHWIADNCHWENGSSGTVGHYMNIINPELAVMGMATCTKDTMSGLQTQCYTAEIFRLVRLRLEHEPHTPSTSTSRS